MNLVIVESPTKAKTIAKFLGDDFKVESSYGHIRDLPKKNDKAVDVANGFLPHYEIIKGKEQVIENLRRLAKKADQVFLATDPDREGEAIAWHLAVVLNLDPKKTKRIVFHEITKEAIEEALRQPRNIDERLRQAQEARRVLDRLVGFDLSELIWKKVRYGLSAGRVQSPALRILMEREREIRAFQPEDFWLITGTFITKTGGTLFLTCTEKPREEKEAQRILQAGEKGSWRVTEVKTSEVKRLPYPPLTTSTLQQIASTRLGFSPARTMVIAQKLYEAGNITYMRTDSVTISEQAKKQILALIKEKFGKQYVKERTYKTKSKLAQEAHEAIRPTNIFKESVGGSTEEEKLYRLIWRRTVSSQMSEALLLKTKIMAGIQEEKIPEFATTGSRLFFDGWLKADPEAVSEDNQVPNVTEGEALKLEKLTSQKKQTEPPGRYTEAGLVKELEKRGIGRPSTYAAIIKTLTERGYVKKSGKILVPTTTGEVVSTFLENNFGNYISDSFTAEMEDELDQIASGSRAYEKTLRDFYEPFSKEVKAKDDSVKLTNLGKAPEKFICPKCGSQMIIKLGKNGTFLSCSRFPECTGVRQADGTVIESPKPIGTDPQSGLPLFVLKGRFGPYVQLGTKSKDNPQPKKASIPKGVDPDSVTVKDALLYLSLPRKLGLHPETGKEIIASKGRFGPYIAHNGDFRALKKDNVYTIDLERALEILKEEKKASPSKRKKQTLKTKTQI